MTTVVYRDGVLCADTQLTCGHSSREGHVRKVFKKGPLLYAWAGSAHHGQAFVDWVRSGCEGKPPDMGAPEQGAEGLIVMPDDLFISWSHYGWSRSRASYLAIGSGSDYALGALAAGATAVQALKAALVHECFSGGDINVIRR